MKVTRLTITLLTAAALLLVFPALSIADGEQVPMKVDKVSTVKYRGPRTVGNMTLPAGAYKVKHRVDSSGQHFVDFTSQARSGQVVVAPVRCELEPAGKKIPHTRTGTVTENGTRRIVKLRVAGNNAAYVF
jgi:hypothetical protein